MQELLLALAQGLVEDKAAVRVTEDEPNEEARHRLPPHRSGRRHGPCDRQAGPHCKAIRVVMRAAAVRENKKVMVEIDD